MQIPQGCIVMFTFLLQNIEWTTVPISDRFANKVYNQHKFKNAIIWYWHHKCWFTPSDTWWLALQFHFSSVSLKKQTRISGGLEKDARLLWYFWDISFHFWIFLPWQLNIVMYSMILISVFTSAVSSNHLNWNCCFVQRFKEFMPKSIKWRLKIRLTLYV